jgi:glycine/D-amino acid oxidase-like deaminating enzyme
MSFPVDNPTESFWRGQVHELDNHRTTKDLPSEVDIVIIGAGYAGASIAYHLQEQSKDRPNPPSIAILEAREACSGATGRNGGHLKPDPYYRAAGALRTHGKEAAEEVAAFEARQVTEIKKLVEKEKIDCDFVVTRASDVCLFDEARDDLKKGLDLLTAARISTADDVFYSDAKTAEGVRWSCSLQIHEALLTMSDLWRKRSKRLLHIHSSTRLALQARPPSALKGRGKRCKPSDTYTSTINDPR